MKVIFLDIDGVLNSSETQIRLKTKRLGIDPFLVGRFVRILKETGAKVVLSSTWRLWSYWRDVMKENGLPVDEFLGATPYLAQRPRGEEIHRWLKDHTGPKVEKYCVLDDERDFLMGQQLFQTTWKKGLTDEIADRVIKYLNET